MVVGNERRGQGGRAAIACSGVSGLVFVSRVVVNEFFLVFANSTLEFVDETIDRGIHIFFNVIAVDGAAIDAGCCFRFMLQLLDGQDTFDVRHNVKVSGYLVYFCSDIGSQGLGYLDMMA